MLDRMPKIDEDPMDETKFLSNQHHPKDERVEQALAATKILKNLISDASNALDSIQLEANKSDGPTQLPRNPAEIVLNIDALVKDLLKARESVAQVWGEPELFLDKRLGRPTDYTQQLTRSGFSADLDLFYKNKMLSNTMWKVGNVSEFLKLREDAAIILLRVAQEVQEKDVVHLTEHFFDKVFETILEAKIFAQVAPEDLLAAWEKSCEFTFVTSKGYCEGDKNNLTAISDELIEVAREKRNQKINPLTYLHEHEQNESLARIKRLIQAIRGVLKEAPNSRDALQRLSPDAAKVLSERSWFVTFSILCEGPLNPDTLVEHFRENYAARNDFAAYFRFSGPWPKHFEQIGPDEWWFPKSEVKKTEKDVSKRASKSLGPK